MEPASLLAHKLRKLASQSLSAQEKAAAVHALLQAERSAHYPQDQLENIQQNQIVSIGRLRAV